MVALEFISLVDNTNQGDSSECRGGSLILALDMSNTFYIIDTSKTGQEVILINDNASRQGNTGTYCEVIKCLSSLGRQYFAVAKWDSISNVIEIRSI